MFGISVRLETAEASGFNGKLKKRERQKCRGKRTSFHVAMFLDKLNGTTLVTVCRGLSQARCIYNEFHAFFLGENSELDGAADHHTFNCGVAFGSPTLHSVTNKRNFRNYLRV